jgi:phosphoribosylcarboxyaminoimidazole (NCAIR) mutase
LCVCDPPGGVQHVQAHGLAVIVDLAGGSAVPPAVVGSGVLPETGDRFNHSRVAGIGSHLSAVERPFGDWAALFFALRAAVLAALASGGNSPASHCRNLQNVSVDTLLRQVTGAPPTE